MKKTYQHPHIATRVVSSREHLLATSSPDCDSHPIVPDNTPGSGEQLSRQSIELL